MIPIQMQMHPHVHKKALVYKMENGNSDYQRLLGTLSAKELSILLKNDDLAERITKITKLTALQLINELEENFGLEVEHYPTGDVCVDSTDLLDAIPDGFPSSHCGWFMPIGEGDTFKEWAQKFLLQEVRINAWLRYLQHRKNKKARVWEGGSGSNYL